MATAAAQLRPMPAPQQQLRPQPNTHIQPLKQAPQLQPQQGQQSIPPPPQPQQQQTQLLPQQQLQQQRAAALQAQVQAQMAALAGGTKPAAGAPGQPQMQPYQPPFQMPQQQQQLRPQTQQSQPQQQLQQPVSITHRPSTTQTPAQQQQQLNPQQQKLQAASTLKSAASAPPTSRTLAVAPAATGPANTPPTPLSPPRTAVPGTDRSKSGASGTMSPPHTARPAGKSSSSSSSARTSLLDSRAEQNKGKDNLPLNVKMMLQKRPEMYADPQFAHNYPVEVWDHYDVNKDGILNKSELLALGKDLVDRIISMCKDSMKAQMPNSSDSDIDKLIKKELPHILPAKTIEESRKVMAEHIYRELDVDKDGVITRTKFFFNWQGVSQKVLDVNKVKQEALSCVIL